MPIGEFCNCIVAADDLIQFLADELSELSKLIVQEQAHEAQIRQLRRGTN